MSIAFGGCQTAIEETLPVEDCVVFSATMEALDGSTKTAMTTQRQVVWSKGDQVAIFYGDNVADLYQIDDKCANTQEGEFTRVEDNAPGERLDVTVALYPYADNLSIEKISAEDSNVDEYEISGFVLPERQTYCADSFGEGTFPMAAITDVNSQSFSFKNLLGALKLQLVGTELVKSIKIKGTNGERLSGAATITVYSDGQAPLVNMSDENGTYVILDCGDGVQLNESKVTTFIIALPPVKFNNGFIAEVYGPDGKVTQKLEATASNKVSRSCLHVMPVKKAEHVDVDQNLEQDGLKYTCEFATESKRLYTIKQNVSGELVTYSKDNKEISRKPFSKDINLETVFSIPEVVYVESETQLSAVKLKGSSLDGDRGNQREEDGFTIEKRTMNYNFRFDGEEKVIAATEFEKLKYGNDELPYTYIDNVRYKNFESRLNEAQTNDDAIVYDVILYFDIELSGGNQAKNQNQTLTVAVPYTRIYERVAHTVVENYSCAGQFGTEEKRLYTISQQVNGELVSYTKNNREISRESFSKEINLEAIFSIPEAVYVNKESQLSSVTLKGSSKDGDKLNKREDDGFTITNRTKDYNFKFDAEEKVTVSTAYEKLQYGTDEMPYHSIVNIRYKSQESYLNESQSNDDVIVHNVTLYFNVEVTGNNTGTTKTQTYTVPVSYKRIYERVEYTVAENNTLFSQFGSEDKHLYTISQKVNGELATYSKYNEEISRRPFSKEINLETIFSIPEVVYVESETQLSAVKLKGSSHDGDKGNQREEDGFTIEKRTMNYNFRFDGEEKVVAATEFEKLKYSNDELPYTYIDNVRYTKFESCLNEAQTNDDAIVYDVTLYFNVELSGRNPGTQTQTQTVAVSYKRIYERKEHIEID